MARVLHLLKGGDPGLARIVIERQLRAGDAVTVGLLPGAEAMALPPGVTLRRVSRDLSYADLVDLVFASDQVITW
jgi:hypothetical protein